MHGNARDGRRRMRPEERRRQLVRCALAEFARRGMRRAVHADVARSARVAVSTVFLYFPTREALGEAVLDEVERFYLELAERVHTSDAPVPEVVIEHFRHFRASVASHPDHAIVWLDWSAAVRDASWARYLEMSERLVAIQQRTLLRGQRDGDVARSLDSEAAARLLIGTTQLAAQLELSEVGGDRAGAVASTAISAVLGAEAPGERAA